MRELILSKSIVFKIKLSFNNRLLNDKYTDLYQCNFFT